MMAQTAAGDPSPRRVPVTVLTGFLGAGKTTLLQKILADPQGTRFGVLVNDFGAINIDAALVVEEGADQISLANGCICCTIKDDLIEATGRLLASTPAPEHIIIETSGVSRPLAVVDALLDDPLGRQVRLDSIFCLVDADGFLNLDFPATELAIDQASCADVVLINKCDVASLADIEAAESTLTGAIANARILRTTFAALPYEVLFAPREVDPVALGLREAAARSQRDHGHGHDHQHDHAPGDHGDEFQSWSWTCGTPLDREKFRRALRQFPPGLLRAKGLLRLAGVPEACGVFHLVGRRTSLELEQRAVPSASLVVAIGRRGSFDPDALTRLCESCVSDDSGAA